MIFFGTRTKVLAGHANILPYNCNHCGEANSIAIFKLFKYFHIFWIPVFPYSSQLVTECGHCKKVVYEREMSPEIRTEIKQYNNSKISLGYYAGLLLIGLFFGSAIIAGITGSVKTNSYLENPEVGDVYELKYKVNKKSVYTLYRVAAVTADSITFDINDYEAQGMKGLRILREQHADSYSEKTTIARTEVDEMKKSRQVSAIIRK